MKVGPWWLLVAWTLASAPGRARSDEAPGPVADRALIIVGLPGDREHELLFRTTAGAWRAWLTGPLGFPETGVRLLAGSTAEEGFADAPATRESIAREVEAVVAGSGPAGRTWVLVLGHANVDDGHAFLHLPGPDFRDDEFGAIFRGLKGREQVFWITTPAAGWFLPPLSTPGRVVVAATERDAEFNETEFPHALAEVSRLPSSRLDANNDGRVSVAELFAATVDRVEARFAADKRIPTEHAQLDDDGDGRGTEPRSPARSPAPDGALAARTFPPAPRTPVVPRGNPPRSRP